MKRLLLAGIMALTGCSSPSAAELARVWESDDSLGTAVVSAAHEVYESGGYLVQGKEGYRAIPVRNSYVSLIVYADEFVSGNFVHRREFFHLLRRARPVHVGNENTSVVSAIDRLLAYESLHIPPAFASDMRETIKSTVARFTYAPEQSIDGAVMRWHTHPGGGGPSPYDYEKSNRPFAVLYHRDGRPMLHIVGEDDEQVVALSRTADP